MGNLELIKETMSSIEIAELTGKEHKNVMAAIRSMEESWVKVGRLNFKLSSYINSQNKEQPCYELSKIECLYIATKFNDEARAKLVLRWEELETERQRPLSTAEMLVRSAQLLVDQEREMNKLRTEVAEIKQRTTTDLKHSTVVAYVSRNGINLDVKRYGAIGTKASNLCKKRGIETSKVNDPRWGSVKVYPDEVLAEVFTAEKERTTKSKEVKV